eukprot:Pompholyxophrys_punicea_v1_NODE_170_length_3030_cov_11.943193.p1 type:complete len:200 gc:universal NODE_170_length_3030_cov_11.943193:2560-1961(-)
MPSLCFLCLIVYRSPSSDLDLFSAGLEELLVKNTSKNLVILGDFNIDLIKIPFTHPYLQILAEFSLLTVISTPTRITSHSATLLDHLHVNFSSFNCVAGTAPFLLKSRITDHSPTYAAFYLLPTGESLKNCPLNSYPCPQFPPSVRPNKLVLSRTYSLEAFLEGLSQNNREAVLFSRDVDVALEKFVGLLKVTTLKFTK